MLVTHPHGTQTQPWLRSLGHHPAHPVKDTFHSASSDIRPAGKEHHSVSHILTHCTVSQLISGHIPAEQAEKAIPNLQGQSHLLRGLGSSGCCWALNEPVVSVTSPSVPGPNTSDGVIKPICTSGFSDETVLVFTQLHIN